MDTILVAGVETVVGANLAAVLSETHRVVGLSETPVSIADCETAAGIPSDTAAMRACLERYDAGHVVCCGPAARSSWELSEGSTLPASATTASVEWAKAAAAANCRLTVISTDAVFTGPWMFHKENSTGQCLTSSAASLRAMEECVVEACPNALIVRTNAFGWSPKRNGWLERTLAGVESRTGETYDCLRHATPILATDLVDVLAKAWEAELKGVYHIAGAERINPARFVERLAEEFDLPMPLRCRVEPLQSRPEGFGCGETSLHTKKVRMALFVAMPTIAEGLQRLHAQKVNGYVDRFGAPTQPARSRVA